jgi:hypothetical protein
MNTLTQSRWAQVAFARRDFLCAAIGVIFIFTSVSKLTRLPQFHLSLQAAGVPEAFSSAVVAAVISGEIILGCSMLFFENKRLPARAAVLMLAMFTGYLGRLLTLPTPPHCDCLGVSIFVDARHEAIFSIVRNVGLSALLAPACIR